MHVNGAIKRHQQMGAHNALSRLYILTGHSMCIRGKLFYTVLTKMKPLLTLDNNPQATRSGVWGLATVSSQQAAVNKLNSVFDRTVISCTGFERLQSTTLKAAGSSIEECGLNFSVIECT